MSKQTEKIAGERNAKLQRLSNLLKPPRLVKEETSLLMGVFGDSPEAYTDLRDLFFGFELDEYQKQLLGQVKSISKLIRKIFLPEVKKDISFGNTYDLWQTKDLQGATADQGKLFIQSKDLLIQFLETSLARLENTDLPGVDLTVQKDLGFILGRNGYISYVDNQIRFLMQHVNMQTMSQEDITAMVQMDSTK